MIRMYIAFPDRPDEVLGMPYPCGLPYFARVNMVHPGFHSPLFRDRRIPVQQPLMPQFLPERRRDLAFQQFQVFGKLR